MGGAWNESTYAFNSADALSSLDRSPTNGIRLMKYTTGKLAATARLPVESLSYEFNRKKPVSDEVFALFKSFYSYDPRPLEAAIESVDDSPAWKRERITFDAAYGKERMIAYLFLPKKVSPPFRTVVYFPSILAFERHSFENVDALDVDFLMKSGRAVMYPIYKGSYERSVNGRPVGVSNERDLVVQSSKDLGRSIDYLMTREDIDHDRLAYFGTSRGANFAPALLAMEPRIRVAVLWNGGLLSRPRLPQVDAINFAPRVKIPVLMLNGRYDLLMPVDFSQVPLFQLLGTPPQDKRHLLFEGGHNMTVNNVVKETLDWLDRYLGPVK
jgi:dienelactone hydrolase